MSEDDIHVIRDSHYTASVTPFTIEDTNRKRCLVVPKLVDNPNDGNKSVSIHIIYEKKKESDTHFPSESADGETLKITRKNVHPREYIELSLRTEATYQLYKKLEELYKLHQTHGLPNSVATYHHLDSHIQLLVKRFENSPSDIRLLSDETNEKLIKTLLRIITQTDSKQKLQDALSSIEEQELGDMFRSCNLSMLNKLAEEIEANLDNSNEEFWQAQIFSKHSWVLGQLFSTPCTMFNQKAYVGGKDIYNAGGNICDFIYQNKLTEGVSIIEIKTPKTELIGSKYRATHSISSELSGAINQVINYKDSLTKNFYALYHQSGNSLNVWNPQCIVVAGKVSSLNKAEKSTFELFRNTFNNITIITYDELLVKIKDLINVLSIQTDNSTVQT